MTLLEILVKELPRRGGWPSENIHALVQGRTGNIYRAGGGSSLLGCALADDWELAEVTREQYEAALSAPKKPEWDGEGLPPVGCECEMAWSEAEFAPCKILFIGESVVLVKSKGREDCYTISTVKFRPIRTEADRKRDETRKYIAASLFNDGDMSTAESLRLATFVYAAIAAGKIPGIRIE